MTAGVFYRSAAKQPVVSATEAARSTFKNGVALILGPFVSRTPPSPMRKLYARP